MPFDFSPTEVMTLGSVRQMRVGDYYAPPLVNFLNPPRTTPSFPQNLARQTIMGLGRFGSTAMGAIPTDIPPALTNQSADPTVSAAPAYNPSGAPVAQVSHPVFSPATRAVWGTLATASLVASTYHGYRRNNSLGWALWWGLMGSLFPVVTPTVAVAQGFAKRKGRR